MKKIFLVFIAQILLVSIILGQGQKMIIKSIVADTDELIVDMNGRVQVTEWHEPYIRIASSIELNNFNHQTIRRLTMVGRYNITSEMINDVLMIKMPKVAHQIIINGEMLEEVIRYEIFVPKGTTVEVKGAHNYISF